jgi:hypothetical protein
MRRRQCLFEYYQKSRIKLILNKEKCTELRQAKKVFINQYIKGETQSKHPILIGILLSKIYLYNHQDELNNDVIFLEKLK